jgi:hypothetical protein
MVPLLSLRLILLIIMIPGDAVAVAAVAAVADFKIIRIFTAVNLTPGGRGAPLWMDFQEIRIGSLCLTVTRLT